MSRSNNPKIDSVRFFRWLRNARQTLEGMVPHDSRNINKKLVHLKDITCYKIKLNKIVETIEKINLIGSSCIEGCSDHDLLHEAQSLHNSVLTSLQSIYKSTYNHRSDKIVALFEILYNIEVHIGCFDRLADSNVTRWSAPTLYFHNGKLILPIGRKATPKAKRPVGILRVSNRP
ncbi:hypothetical protein [Yersinia enterocolitica]|uniref:hypothetical protein n=1 Tax=Yersinia enterocolitica TaxID=630 RepID=UPI00227BBA71|nr:hypothetical protein [Yersinia enterocolitica]MCY1688719.1 hypothetical protein [Yersinia enterocolitica]